MQPAGTTCMLSFCKNKDYNVKGIFTVVNWLLDVGIIILIFLNRFLPPNLLSQISSRNDKRYDVDEMGGGISKRQKCLE